MVRPLQAAPSLERKPLGGAAADPDRSWLASASCDARRSMAVGRWCVARMSFAACAAFVIVRCDLQQDVRRYGRRGRRCCHRRRERARRVPGSTSIPSIARGDAQGVCPSETASAAALRWRTTPRGMTRRRIAWSNRFWSDDLFTSEPVKTSFGPSPPRPATGAIPPAVRPVKEHMRGRGQVEECRHHRVRRIAASCEAWRFSGGTGFGVNPFVV